eukprot:NODE_18182_length_906_cov_3.931964.p2 GENE.NODE_18182_length_906_cov_3.931964~~NODE_18182_length_906_cov_3.931964.p2  ORF type:complete len:160 (-),score=35.52 NODE_18182_length_906_cov_3.931964:107-586(-)
MYMRCPYFPTVLRLPNSKIRGSAAPWGSGAVTSRRSWFQLRLRDQGLFPCFPPHARRWGFLAVFHGSERRRSGNIVLRRRSRQRCHCTAPFPAAAVLFDVFVAFMAAPRSGPPYTALRGCTCAEFQPLQTNESRLAAAPLLTKTKKKKKKKKKKTPPVL